MTVGRLRMRAWIGTVAMAFGLAAVPPARALDLVEAYRAALAQDAVSRAARAGVVAGDERVEQAKALLRPNLSFSAARATNDLRRRQDLAGGGTLRSDGDYHSRNTTLTLRQPLYRQGLEVGLEQARQLREEGVLHLEHELQNLGVRVTDAYLQLLLAQDQFDLSDARQQAATTGLQAARRLLEGGAGTRTDVDEAQARLDMATAQALETTQQLAFARRQLEILVHQPAYGLHALDLARLAAWAPETLDVQEWITRAEDHSPEIAQRRSMLEGARLAIRKARSGHLPTLDAVAQWARSDSENLSAPNSGYTNFSVGLQLNVPLYAGGQVSSAVRQAIAEETQARELLEALRRDLSLRIHTEWRAVTEGPLRLRALEQAARSAARLVVSSRRSYEGGARTLVDVLDAEQQHQGALSELARARYAWLLACVRLQALAGGDRLRSIEAINALLRVPEGGLPAPPVR